MSEKEKDRPITISYRSGDVTLSFATDLQGSNLPQMMETVKKIVERHGKLWTSNKGQEGTVYATPRAKATSHRGSAETSVIKQRVKEGLLPDGFFKKGRKTSDVSAELVKRFQIKFTSRKVSQALGDLREEGLLSRVGAKGDFVYLEP